MLNAYDNGSGPGLIEYKLFKNFMPKGYVGVR